MKRISILSAVLALVLVSFNGFCQCPTTPQLFRGEGTFYGYNGGGNCSFPFPYTSMHTAALNQSQYASSQLCGACAQVTGERGTITVSIQDQCPECKFGDIDLSQKAFPLIADPIKGRVPITWKIVPCPVTGPIAFYFKEGSSRWWTAVQVRNHKYPVKKFEYKVNGSYVTVKREAYNYFVVNQGMGPGPFSFRITDIYGHVIEETNVPLRITTPINGTKQFASCPATARLAGLWEEKIQSYPNPVSDGKLHLANNSDEPIEYELVDVMGTVIEKSSIPALSQKTLDLPKKTVYVLNMQSNGHAFRRRIVSY